MTEKFWIFPDVTIPPRALDVVTNTAGFLGLWLAISALYNNLTDWGWLVAAAACGAVSMLGLIARLKTGMLEQGATVWAARGAMLMVVLLAALVMVVPQVLGLAH